MRIPRLELNLFRSSKRSETVLFFIFSFVVVASLFFIISPKKIQVSKSTDARRVSIAQTSTNKTKNSVTTNTSVKTDNTAISDSNSTNKPPTSPTQSSTSPAVSNTSKPATQTIKCPYANAPSNQGDYATVPSGLLGAIMGMTPQINSTTPAITLSTENNSGATWTPENVAGSPVYIANSASVDNAPKYSFQVVVQPNATIGLVYWVYINILFISNNTTAEYSLPVSPSCT